MKDKNDTKTLGLALAKTNAERQQEYRDRIKGASDTVRLSTYISCQANEKLTSIMKRHDLKKKEAVSLVLESLSEHQIDEAFASVLRDGRKWAAK